MSYTYVRPGDERPTVQAVLSDAAGQPVDLTGATVELKLRGATVRFLAAQWPASVVDAAGGKVELVWGDAVQTPTAAGLYFAHWLVTYSGGDNETFPNGSNGSVIELISD